MKKLALLLLFAATLNYSSAQSRYLVYFADKGIQPGDKISKLSKTFAAAAEALSQKSIERRIKSMGEDNYLTYEDIPVVEEYIRQVEEMGITIHQKLKWFNAVSCYLSAEQFNKVSKLPFVKKIDVVRSFKRTPEKLNRETNFISRKDKGRTANYNYGPSFFQYAQVEVMPVHQLGLTGDGVIIGLIDAGFDWENQLSTKNLVVLAEYDFVSNDGEVANEDGDAIGQHNHGTYVLSITGGNAPGNIVGPAFGASFILAKTEDTGSEKRIEEDNYVAALEWQESLGADIISSSVGYNIFDDGEISYTYEDMDGNTSITTIASELAFERGVVTVTSAGNSGDDDNWIYITIPADGENVISVGAVNDSGVLAGFSSRGPTYDGRIKPEVVALGVNVYMATPGAGEYKLANGTSFSAPIVTGITGLLLEAHPHLTNRQVRKIILESGDNSASPDNNYGYGLVSAKRAVAFPNMSLSDGVFTLHKIFIDSEGVQAGSPKLYYSVNGAQYTVENMTFDGDLGYTFEFPFINQSDLVEFHFTYNNDNGQLITDPVDNNYRFASGSINISLYTNTAENPVLPKESALLQNYPNPFNGETNIVFISEDESPAQLKIYDILGRKVRDLFTGTLQNGTNFFTWDSKSNSGIRVPSGIYFYTLTSKGSIFTKKLVLLK